MQVETTQKESNHIKNKQKTGLNVMMIFQVFSPTAK